MADTNANNDSFLDKVKRVFTGESSDYDQHDDYYRQHHGSRSTSSGSSSSLPYDNARPGYQLGHLAGSSADYDDRSFDDVETDLRTSYEGNRSTGHGSWDDVRDYARDGYQRGREARLTLSEEQLTVGKRQVQAGEVQLGKTVETEHVRESVPLVHEEVTIERRPLSADGNVDAATIGEESIRVPLMREEAVAGKRVVGVEEVVLHKQQVTENQTIEADVQRERLATDGLEQSGSVRGAGLQGSGAADRATDSGLGDRLADKVDDLKDRVDGNPSSRPGPDATDRRI